LESQLNDGYQGDFSGIAKEGIENLHTERHAKINIPYKVSKFPVELLTLSSKVV
jgi:hypothetical protein